MNTQGQALEEVRENLHQALRPIIKANRELAARSQTAYQVVKEPIEIDI